jgi:hypothetical protein
MGIPSPADLSRARLARRQAAEKRHAASRLCIGNGMIQLAIGRAGGAACLGWELHRSGSAPQFYRTKEQAIAAAQESASIGDLG